MKISWRRGGAIPIDPRTDEHGNPVHVHDFRPVDAQPNARIPMQLASTVVLMKCACGQVTSETISGTWTIDQIRGATDATA